MSSTIVVLLSVAVVNEVLAVRRGRHWAVLAQYVMLQLVRDARIFWTGILQMTGLLPVGATTSGELDAARGQARDAANLTQAVREMLDDADGRRALRDHIARVVAQNDEVLGRWASVMLNADIYAEVVDRHVELAADLAWFASVLECEDPRDGDALRRHRARSHPAVLLAGDLDDDLLAQRLVTITQLAERLDSGTLELALKIVPVSWWRARLARAPQPEDEPASIRGEQIDLTQSRA